MTTAVLVHGWGYDARLWGAVIAHLDPALKVEAVDFGFYGAVLPLPTFDEPVIAVGHSLGALWWLMQSDVPWRTLLCINGFPRFTETAGYAPAVAPRVLERMRQQFAKSPAAVLADFHARCGGHAPSGLPDIEHLAAGLGWLSDYDGRAVAAVRHNDIFALAGSHDPIVPQAMSAMAFTAHCEFVETTGHLLPFSHPELCARWIERLAR